jgi:multiple sugar transport system substrate-binding protein
MQALVDEWNATHDVQVTAQAVTLEDLLSTIMTRQSGGQPADIIQAYGLWGGQLEAGGVFAPLPEDIAADISENYSASGVEASTAGGQLLGYPTEVQTYALYYNKELLGDAQPPTTWEELEEVAAQTTQRDDAGNVTVTGFGLGGGWDSAVVHPFLSLVQAAGGSFVGENGASVVVDSDAARETLEFEKRLLDAGVSDPTIDQLKGFPADQIAMTINASWWLGSLRAQMGEAYSKVGVVPIPGPTAGSRGSLAYGFFMGVNSKSQNQEAAWEFLRWANAEEAENGATRMGTMENSFGTIPPRPSDIEALSVISEDPNAEPFTDALEYAALEPNMVAGAQIKSEIQKAVESVWAGTDDIDSALSKAQSAIDSATAG